MCCIRVLRSFDMQIVTILSLMTSVAASLKEDMAPEAIDPKEIYFRYIRTYSPADDRLTSSINVMPQPLHFPDKPRRFRRFRRADDDETEKQTNAPSSDDLAHIDEKLKALEGDNRPEDADATVGITTDIPQHNAIVINDFLRFERSAREAIVAEEAVDEAADMLRPKREMFRQKDGRIAVTNREALGASEVQWLKQPYPVQTTDPGRSFDEPSAAALPSAPRVHFVTQRRSESAPPLLYHSYEQDLDRKSRSKQHDIDLGAEYPSRDRIDRGLYHQRGGRYYNQRPIDSYPRRTSQFHSPRPDTGYRDYNRYRNDWDRKWNWERDGPHGPERLPGPSFGYNYNYYTSDDPGDRYHDEDRPTSSFTKPRRIIYYATLPEIVRDPGGERYNYRGGDRRYPIPGRLGDRLGQSPASSPNYRLPSNVNNSEKSRYDETKGSGAKISSPDVSIRTIKKNPERRIYTEIDSQYPYKQSAFHTDDLAHYSLRSHQ